MRPILPILAALAACTPEAASVDLASSLVAQSDSEVQVRTVDGRVTAIRGAFPLTTAMPEAAAEGFLIDQLQALGLHPETTFDIELVREGLRGTYVRLNQRHMDVPVHNAQAIVLVTDTHIAQATLRLHSFVDAPEAAVLDADEAIAAAVASTQQGHDRMVRPEVLTGLDADGRIVHRVRMVSLDGQNWDIDVDGVTGEILRSVDERRFVAGSGLVYDPNPVSMSGGIVPPDNNDATSANLDALLINANFDNLDGTGLLRGTWVDAQQGGRANEPTFIYNYDRADDRFEEVMTYHHIDRTQTRYQDLGFVNINARQQVVNVNGFTFFLANSFFSPQTLEITLGDVGVDHGEDADVIVHEYGHATQHDQTGNWGSGTDAGSMGEGFGDYLAASFRDTLSGQTWDTECMGPWAASEFNLDCIRRLDTDLHYPEDWDVGGGFFGADIHGNGQIWSGALWAARDVVGADVMDTIVLEHHFAVPQDPTLAEAVDAVLATADALYGSSVRDDVRRALVWQGVSQEITPPSALNVVQNTVVGNITHPRVGGKYPNSADLVIEITEAGAQGLSANFLGIDTQLNKDFVYIYDGDGNLYQVFTGLQLGVSTVVVPGDTMQVRIVSNDATNARGWLIDSVDVY